MDNEDIINQPLQVNANQLLTASEAAHYLRIAKGTLANYRCLGGGPRFRKHGHLVVYHIQELHDWSAKRQQDK